MPKLSEQPAVNSIVNSDVLYVVASGDSKKVTAGNLMASLTQVKSAPPTAKGEAGDKRGMLAFSNTHLYLCLATYDGTSNIWVRASLSNLW